MIFSFPVTVGAGDVLTWTPDVSAKGKVTAFNVRVTDGSDNSLADVPVLVLTIDPCISCTER